MRKKAARYNHAEWFTTAETCQPSYGVGLLLPSSSLAEKGPLMCARRSKSERTLHDVIILLISKTTVHVLVTNSTTSQMPPHTLTTKAIISKPPGWFL